MEKEKEKKKRHQEGDVYIIKEKHKKGSFFNQPSTFE